MAIKRTSRAVNTIILAPTNVLLAETRNTLRNGSHTVVLKYTRPVSQTTIKPRIIITNKNKEANMLADKLAYINLNHNLPVTTNDAEINMLADKLAKSHISPRLHLTYKNCETGRITKQLAALNIQQRRRIKLTTRSQRELQAISNAALEARVFPM